MGSTNKTDILDLNQFVDDDKPTWRGDYNSDMIKIDHFAEETYDALIVAATETSSARAIAVDAGDKADAAEQAANSASNAAASATNAAQAATSAANNAAQLAQNAPTVAWNQRTTSPLSNVVFIGSSNSMSNGWVTKLSARHGWNERNYANNGGGYTLPSNSFLQQVQAAAADTQFSNDTVGYVFITDASNDIRGQFNVDAAASSTYSLARSSFPHARIIVVPVIWPSSPQNFAPPATGGYRQTWHDWLHINVERMALHARRHNIEFIPDTWTWLTGHDEWMRSGEVHPNDAGHQQIADRVDSYIRGSHVTPESRWIPVTYGSSPVAQAPGVAGQRDLSTLRNGWDVTIDGAIKVTGNWVVDGAGVGTDLGWIDPGDRPTYPAELVGHTGSNFVRLIAYPNGLLRAQTNVTAPATVYVAGRYVVG